MSEIAFPLATSTWDADEYGALQRVIESGMFTMGREVKQFEEDFAAKFGSRFAVMVNSGSSANLLGLAALTMHPDFHFDENSEVIVPAVSWATTYYPVNQVGMKLVFVDVNPVELSLDLDAVREAITPNTRAIFAVNLLGNPAQLDVLKQLCDEKGIFLLEDNCESMGATLHGRHAGTYGFFGTYSTFFSHHISTMEGGVIVTDDDYLYQAMISMRAHGWTRELPADNLIHPKSGDAFEDLFRFVLPGYNLRPIEMMGALGQSQLRKLDAIVAGRRENAERFKQHFANSPDWDIQREVGMSSWFGFSFVFKNGLKGKRREIVSALSRVGVESRPIVAGNFTLNPVMSRLNARISGSMAHANAIHSDGLFVGNHHYGIGAELQLLSETIEKVRR